jgi:hypothetical protein
MAEERVQRRLAAILAADVVGYSRMMGLDEAGTRARFNAHLQNLIEPAIADRKGRIVKTMGDGLLVEFTSVVDAVECAVAIQDGMKARNTDDPADKRIEFRIGVNLGDVIIEGDDIHGDVGDYSASWRHSANVADCRRHSPDIHLFDPRSLRCHSVLDCDRHATIIHPALCPGRLFTASLDGASIR